MCDLIFDLSPNLSPARREALNSPPSLVGKGAGGLGSSKSCTRLKILANKITVLDGYDQQTGY